MQFHLLSASLSPLGTTLPAAYRLMFQVAVDKLATTVADADEPAATVAEVEVAAEEVVPRAPALRCQSAST